MRSSACPCAPTRAPPTLLLAEVRERPGPVVGRVLCLQLVKPHKPAFIRAELGVPSEDVMQWLLNRSLPAAWAPLPPHVLCFKKAPAGEHARQVAVALFVAYRVVRAYSCGLSAFVM